MDHSLADFYLSSLANMTTLINTLLDEIISREGSKDTNDPRDSGGRTKYGISEKWHPEAWKDGPPSLADAREIYFQLYIVKPNLYQINPEFLLKHLVDYGVLSGSHRAIVALQDILGVKRDGKIGPITLGALSTRDPKDVNNKIVDRRILLMTRIVQQRPRDLVWLFGWISRALQFRV